MATDYELKYTPGPTYEEMADPTKLPPAVRAAALRARANELDPLNLFNITWLNEHNRPRYVVLPRELTGTKANIIVLTACSFPSGSHKVGPAYATMAEAEALGKVTHDMTIIGPSTGNFGIGTAYIARLKGFKSIVVMPEGMSAERYDRIRKYGGELILTPGSESDVILVLERVVEFKHDPTKLVLGQFELLPNYRFHRHTTGQAALRAAAEVGNGKVAAFVSAPGSAGTIAAADAVKEKFADAAVVAVEPKECATLTNGGRGTHRIEGIGDKMVTLIHNVLNTDYVLTVHDDDTVKGLYVFHELGAEGLSELVGARVDGKRAVEDLCAACQCSTEAFDYYCKCFGISSICNIMGAIRTAHYLGLGEGDNVVTIATDGFDRYPSVMRDLEQRVGRPIDRPVMTQWFEQIFRQWSPADFLDVRSREQKERLFRMKEETWLHFEYSKEYLDRMKSQTFWDEEYALIPKMDEAIAALRERSGAWPPVR
jgi:cysteine synthase